MILSKPSKHAFFTEGESMTEQEHAKACDVNYMIQSALRGIDPHTRPVGPFGFDDLTKDAVSHRIEKQRLEEELQQSAEALEFTQAQLDAIPQAVKAKYSFKLKKPDPPKTPAQNDDDKTTTNKAGTDPVQTIQNKNKSGE